jgi:hypothetical protein
MAAYLTTGADTNLSGPFYALDIREHHRLHVDHANARFFGSETEAKNCGGA